MVGSNPKLLVCQYLLLTPNVCNTCTAFGLMHARCLFLVPILGSICWTPKTHFPNPTFTLKSQLPFRIPHSLSFSPPPFFFRYLSHFPVYSNSRSNQPTSKSLQQGKITMVIFRAAHMEYEKGCCKLVASPKMHLNMELK